MRTIVVRERDDQRRYYGKYSWRGKIIL